MATMMASKGGFQLCEKRTTYVQVSGVMSQVGVGGTKQSVQAVQWYCCAIAVLFWGGVVRVFAALEGLYWVRHLGEGGWYRRKQTSPSPSNVCAEGPPVANPLWSQESIISGC